MNLSIFKLLTQTQAAFWFMLFNWIECNNYSITIGTERRKILAEYYSRSNDPNSRSVQNIFRGLTKTGLLIKCKKSDLICKSNKTYEVTYRIPFIVSQQKMNDSFIKLHKEIIQLKSESRAVVYHPTKTYSEDFITPAFQSHSQLARGKS